MVCNDTAKERGLRRTVSLEKSKRNWMQILIYLTGDGICSGYVDCPYRRLLDLLNNVSSITIQDSNEEYLRVKEARIDWLKRREAAEAASINKHDILFVKPTGDAGIPLVPKQSRRTRLLLSSYILTGQIHYHRGRHWRNSLDSVFNFFSVTNVEISSTISGIKRNAHYVAVNKLHVSSVEEIADSLGGVRV